MEWFEELDFVKNPFELNPLETELELIGREKETKELLYRIISSSMLLIEGKAGTGKTALLKYAIDNFKGKGKVIYVDGNKLNKRLNVSNLLRKKPKGMILLMDNVQYISKKNNERIKYYYDQDHIKSVVFTTTDRELVNFSDAIRDRIGKNIIKLKELSQSKALETVKARLEDKELLSNDVIKEIYKESANLKEFIAKCDLLCRYAVKKGKDSADKKDIKEIVDKEIDEEDDSKEYCEDCSEKLVKVGEHWRCENCDSYCDECGELIEEEDETCPGCGAKLGEKDADKEEKE